MFLKTVKEKNAEYRGVERRKAKRLADKGTGTPLPSLLYLLFKRSSFIKRMKDIENLNMFYRYQNWMNQYRSTLKAQFKQRP